MNGVLFERGSAKYLKLIPSNARFHSSKKDATVLDKDYWEENKDFILNHHNVDWYSNTIEFVSIED